MDPLPEAFLLPHPPEHDRALRRQLQSAHAEIDKLKLELLESRNASVFREVEREIQEMQSIPGFTVVCGKCGGVNIQFEHNDLGASDCTDFGSEYIFRCRTCGNHFEGS